MTPLRAASVPGPGSAAPESLRRLLGIAGRMATTTSCPELMHVAAQGTLELLAVDAAMLWLLDGERFRLAAAAGLPPEAATSAPPLELAEPAVADLLAGPPVFPVPDAHAVGIDGLLARYAPYLPTGSVLVAQLRDGGQCVGLLSAAMRGPRAWTAEEVELAEGLATHAGLALRNTLLFERLETRANQLAVVQAASSRISGARTVEAVGRAIVEEVAAMVEYHNARVYLLEPPDDLVPVAFEGRVGAYEKVDLDLLRTRVGVGFTGWVALNGEALLVRDATDDPRGATIPGTDDVPESMLIVPVSHDGEVVGVITLSKLGVDQFSPDDLQVISILADQAATALGSARLLTRTETLASELRRLLDMSAELAQSLDPKLVGEVIARHLTLALGVDACAISAWDLTGDRIVSLAQYPDAEAVEKHPEYLLAEYPETRRVLEEAVTVIIDAEDPDADRAEVVVLREQGYRTLAMFPLIAKGQAVGLVELLATGLVAFDDGRLALVRTMANEAAMALENARLYDAARTLADRDPLTGFYNHRYLHERLGEEVVRARRSRQPLSLLMVDLDDFKLVNDTFGHQSGDRFLVHLAEVIRTTLRASDVPARYGGDEFAAILPDTDADGAADAAERILDALAARPLAPAGRGDVPLSVSIGVAALSHERRTPADIIDAADQAMYVAKKSGGSMAVVDDLTTDGARSRRATEFGEPLAALGSPDAPLRDVGTAPAA